ncbi:MAG: sulfatase [Chitinophagaceae bacterium]
MRTFFFFFFLCAVLPEAVARQQPPNIILFLVDDMGWMDTSVPFGDSIYPLNKGYHTPNMERLSREGMMFTSAYASPVCTPSRVSLLTGMNPAHHGVTNWTSPVKDNPTDSQDELFFPPDWKFNGLSSAPGIPHTVYATPFPQILKQHGYFTIHVGKAHWGSAGTPGSNPYNLGFMVNIAGNAIGHPQSYLGKEHYGNMPGKTTLNAVPDLQEYHGSDTFLTHALTLEALKALEEPIQNRQPFFLNMSHYAVHDPLTADARFIQKYLDRGLDLPAAKFASLIEGMDKSLGDIMDHLHKKGVEKNTIIIFMSDNGSLSVYQRGGAPHTQNFPLRAGKGSVYEGGIREPMIVKWPGKIKKGAVTRQQVILEDFFPTILEMAGIKKYNTVQQIDGISFLPLLKQKGEADAARPLIWHYPNKWRKEDGPGINYFSAIRVGDWKLVYNLRSGISELYNLKIDMGESHDLAKQYPDKVKALRAMLGEKLRTWNAPMPVVRETGAVLSYPGTY